MRIKINEREIYEIDVKEELTKQDFFEMMSRLNLISKILGKDEVVEAIQNSAPVENPKRKYKLKRERPLLFTNRLECLKFLKLHYTGTMEEKREFAKALGYKNYAALSVRAGGLKKRFNVQPHEVGLVKFPSRGRSVIGVGV